MAVPVNFAEEPPKVTVQQVYETKDYEEILEIIAVMYRIDVPFVLNYDGLFDWKLTMFFTGMITTVE